MQFFHQLLSENSLLALFVIVGSGLLLGKISIRGIQLGSSGVLFTALLGGHLGYALPSEIGTLGLLLFVYCIGIGAGGRFFAAIAHEGAALAKLAAMIVGTGALITFIGATLLDLPADLASGIFAGALTSTPALAASIEGIQGDSSGVSIGYGIAYPCGVIGVILFVQILPRCLKHDWDATTEDDQLSSARERHVETALVEVTNRTLFGKQIADSNEADLSACQISRIFNGDQLVPHRYDDRFHEGQLLLLVGLRHEIESTINFLGKRSDRHVLMDVENERRQLLVTAREIAGQTLQAIAPLKNYGVVITRINRLGLTFVPNTSTVIEQNDTLTVVGPVGSLKEFSKIIGHRESAIGITDLLSLSVGLTLSILVGLIPFTFPGGTTVKLGLAGGPLVVALVLGHFGRIGKIVGHIPRPTRLFLQEIGLVFFLANAGVNGGVSLVATIQEYGFSVFGLGLCVTAIPLFVAWPIAHRHLKLNPLQSLGGICGSMTSTPALGAITSKTDSQIPVVSYVSAYPVALVVMILFAKTLISSLS